MQASTRSFQYCNTECLSERGVQKDRTLPKDLHTTSLKVEDEINEIKCAHRRNIPVRNRAEQGDSILQEVHFPHLEEIDHFGPIATCAASCNERNHMNARETYQRQNER